MGDGESFPSGLEPRSEAQGRVPPPESSRCRGSAALNHGTVGKTDSGPLSRGSLAVGANVFACIGIPEHLARVEADPISSSFPPRCPPTARRSSAGSLC
jgi:hypothetical protein